MTIVGITSSERDVRVMIDGAVHPTGSPRTAVANGYPRRIAAAGAVPLLLPDMPPERLREAVGLLDGLVLPGGPDIDPARYGQRPHESVRVASEHSDEQEMLGLSVALERGLPVLGVCRGLQLINVARGGSLHQHLPLVTGQAHRLETGRRHSVSLAGRLGEILGERVETGSSHHQAVDRLGEGLRVAGRAEDGIVEAIEDPSHPFLLAVQWHPEADETGERLFAAFVDACRTRLG